MVRTSSGWGAWVASGSLVRAPSLGSTLAGLEGRRASGWGLLSGAWGACTSGCVRVCGCLREWSLRPGLWGIRHLRSGVCVWGSGGSSGLDLALGSLGFAPRVPGSPAAHRSPSVSQCHEPRDLVRCVGGTWVAVGRAVAVLL